MNNYCLIIFHPKYLFLECGYPLEMFKESFIMFVVERKISKMFRRVSHREMP